MDPLRSADELRQRRIKLAATLREKAIRDERVKQSNPNGGLLEFIKYFWHVLEPVDPFVEGWPLECLCAHLEAITRGETIELEGNERPFNRFLGNVSPGFMKSLTLNAFWPAWEWGPIERPHLRYVAFSYAAELTERDNAKFRDLICSDAYRELWGYVFKVIGDGKVRVTNDKTGFKFASSIGGIGTGERGHRVLCLAGDQNVLTEHGPVPIVDLVENRTNCRAWSYDEKSGRIGLKPITGWHKNPGRPLIRITTERGGSITCTHDHEIYTSQGRRIAAILGIGDQLLTTGDWQTEVSPSASCPDVVDSARPHAELSGQFRARVCSPGDLAHLLLGKTSGWARMVLPASIARWLDIWRLRFFPSPVVHRRQIQVEMLPQASGADAINGGRAGVELIGQRDKIGRTIIGTYSFGQRAHDVSAQVSRSVAPRAVPFAIRDVVSPRAILKIAERWVASGAIFVSDFLASWTWPNEGFHHQVVHLPIRNFAVDTQAHARVSIFGGRREQQAPLEAHWTAGPVRYPIQTANTPEIGDLVETFKPSDRAPILDRIRSIDLVHDVPSFTYCITVEGNHTMICGDEAKIVTKQCDDIHKVKGQQETAEARKSVTDWVLEGMQNRLNDLVRDAIVIFMQRLHEEDASGVIQKELRDEYCCLMIPMEYEGERHFSDYKGWNNGEDPRSEDGELAWPERYPRTALASYRRNQFLWAGQYQQSPTPRGGGIFKEDWFQPYEVPADGQWDIQPEFALASLDTAFKESEENDYTALTIWWVYDHPKTGQRRIMLVDGWQKRLPLNGKFVQRRNDEDERAYLRRASKDWGVVEWVNYTCTKRNVDRLLIEDSARGYDVSRELQRVFGDATWGTLLVPARGEKWIRAHAVVDLFTNEMIYAPGQWTCGTHGTLKGKCECPAERFGWEWRDWAQDIIHQICRFPRGAHDDLVDSMTMALRHLREQQLAMRREERVLMEKEMNTYRKPLPPVYEA